MLGRARARCLPSGLAPMISAQGPEPAWSTQWPRDLEAPRNAGATGQYRPVRSILLQWDAALRREPSKLKTAHPKREVEASLAL